MPYFLLIPGKQLLMFQQQLRKIGKIEIRNPAAIRPWQHVLEPLSGYLLLGQKLLEHGKKYAESFNFGPNENSVLKVADVAQIVIENYGKGEIVVHKKDNLHEANLLMLNIEKAEKILNWRPAYTANTAITKTVEWYKHFYSQDKDMYEFTLQQWVIVSGEGGNGGGSTNICWASEWRRWFEGQELHPDYSIRAEDVACRTGTYWSSTPVAEDGLDGLVLIRW